jgi:hypothetical protein
MASVAVAAKCNRSTVELVKGLTNPFLDECWILES